MSTNFYPSNPVDVDPNLTIPGKAFKMQVMKVILAIVLFVLVYLLMVALSVALAIGCIYLGIKVMTFARGIMAILLGAAIIFFGLLVCYFLLKFIFAKANTHNPQRIRIFEDEHPKLFEFVRQLAKDTNVPMPKKIYVVPDINAAVFYNSNFWSMFLPVRKNLEIGLGLVNILNLSEFKMVIAHEFGHFSQKSMKLGSYTYSVNRIIYNILYENDGYNNILSKAGSVHAIFSIITMLAATIARGIQAILKGMFSLINKPYYKLSREMEFHADAVALSVVGTEAATSSMMKIETLQFGYDISMSKLNEWIKQEAAPRNMFDAQYQANLLHSEWNDIPVKEGLLYVEERHFDYITPPRLVVQDQWASHPPTEERIKRFKVANIENVIDTRSAWSLFENKESMQERATRHLVEVSFPNLKVQEWRDTGILMDEVKTFMGAIRFPGIFRDYYEGRSFVKIEPGELPQGEQRFEDIYNEKVIARIRRHFQNERELYLLKMIQGEQVKVKHFTFDGVRYRSKDVEKIIKVLEVAVQEDTKWLEELDLKGYALHLQLARVHSEDMEAELVVRYQEIVRLEAHLQQLKEALDNLFNTINTIYGEEHTLIRLKILFNELKVKENKLKSILLDFEKNNWTAYFYSAGFAGEFEKFLRGTFQYFDGNNVMADEINLLFSIGNQVEFYAGRIEKSLKKNYLEAVKELV